MEKLHGGYTKHFAAEMGKLLEILDRIYHKNKEKN